MGARPVAAFLSLGLPSELVKRQGAERCALDERFLDGFLALAEACNTPLAGGDLAESPLVAATLFSSARCGAERRCCVQERGRATYST